MNTGLYYTLMLLITSLTVVVLMTVVGLVLVIALLTLPAAAASPFAKKLWHMMWLAGLFCAVAVVVGIWMSYELDWPSGASIIVIATLVYGLMQGLAAFLKRRRANVGTVRNVH